MVYVRKLDGIIYASELIQIHRSSTVKQSGETFEKKLDVCVFVILMQVFAKTTDETIKACKSLRNSYTEFCLCVIN